MKSKSKGSDGGGLLTPVGEPTSRSSRLSASSSSSEDSDEDDSSSSGSGSSTSSSSDEEGGRNQWLFLSFLSCTLLFPYSNEHGFTFITVCDMASSLAFIYPMKIIVIIFNHLLSNTEVIINQMHLLLVGRGLNIQLSSIITFLFMTRWQYD